MGNHRSRPLSLSYEEAVKRLSPDELQRLEACFKRHRQVNKDTLPFYSFRNHVLSPAVPEIIAQHLYEALGGGRRNEGKGLSFKELMVGMVLMTKCNQADRIKFLFHLFSEDGEWVVMKRVSEKLHETESPNKLSPTLLSAIAQTDKLSVEEFQRWIMMYKNEITVALWLLDFPPSLTNQEPTTTFYQTLSGVTHLDEREIMDLEQHWWRIADVRLRKMDFDKFKTLVSPPVPLQLVGGLFVAFDENGDAQIDFKELVCGLSACCRGPIVDRRKFCFKVFDMERRGYLDAADVEVMVRRLLLVHQELNTDSLVIDSVSEMEPSELSQTVPLDENGRLDLSDFMLWSDDKAIVTEFLQLLFEVCHIVLGLKPESKDIEQSLVRNWMKRERGVGLCEGNLWYLVSSEWWTQWEQWVDYQSPPGTPRPESDLGRIRGDSVVEWCEGAEGVKIKEKEMDTAQLIHSEEKKGRGRSPAGDIWANSPSTSALPPATPPLGPPRNPGGSTGSSCTGSSGSVSGSPRRSLRNWSPCPRNPPSSSPVRVALKPSTPGPIDNQNLLMKEKPKWMNLPSLTHEGGLIRGGLLRDKDFQLVNDALWAAFCRWYGNGNPALPRKVIMNPETKEMELELYPVTVVIERHQMGGAGGAGTVFRTNPYGSISSAFSMTAAAVSHAARDWNSTGQNLIPRRVAQHRVTFSRVARVRDLFDYLCRHFRLIPDTARLWLRSAEEEDPLLLDEEELSFMELGITTSIHLLLEVRNKDLTWPEEMSSLAKNRQVIDKTVGQASEPGITGLYNLGNTCFMNSALQCVSNTQPLTQYFTKNVHLYELNKENVLGMKGNVAMAYAKLVQEIWCGKSKFVAPLKLKSTIGKYAPRFNDLNQHDCQELLSFLLDGLHEDLNRVHQKPYTELKDSDGRPDEVVAAEAWDNHVKRNQSVIVDLFHGLLKSEVSCKECNHSSVRFDPFTFLSLPLPLDNFILLQIVVVKLDGSTPMKFGIRSPAEDSVLKLKERLSELCKLDPERLLLVELTLTGRISRFLSSDDRVKRIQSTPNSYTVLYGFEVPPVPCPSADHSEGEGEGVGTTQVNVDMNTNGWIPNGYTAHPNKGHQQNGDNSVPVLGHNRSLSSVSASSNWSTRTGGSVGGGGSAGDSWGPTAPSFGPVIGYTLGFHRKLEHEDPYFMSHQRASPVMFGLPLVLPADGVGGGWWTGSGLYQEVWRQVARLVTPPAKSSQVNHATDGDETNSEYPFVLRMTNKEGLRCALCPWFRFCYGCEIGMVEERVELEERTFIAVDWDLTAVHLRYQFTLEMASVEDETVRKTAEAHAEPISLKSCLQAFTTPEELNDKDTYYCSKCQKHCPARKKLDIWKLPPILVVHFKRFQQVYNRWVKSCKMVTFPREGFDPREFLPSRQVSMERRRESGLERLEESGEGEGEVREDEGAAIVAEKQTTSQDDIPLFTSAEKKEPMSPVKKLMSMAGKSTPGMDFVTPPSSTTSPPDVSLSNGRECSSVNPRLRTESTTSVAPMLNPNDHRLKEGEDPEDLNYNLYAIACHYGVLGAGHYVCYARHSSGHWYLFNDSRCKEVNPDDIDGNYAYLLFYERRGLDYSQYIPDVAGKRVVEGEEEETGDGGDDDSRCSIQ